MSWTKQGVDDASWTKDDEQYNIVSESEFCLITEGGEELGIEYNKDTGWTDQSVDNITWTKQ